MKKEKGVGVCPSCEKKGTPLWARSLATHLRSPASVAAAAAALAEAVALDEETWGRGVSVVQWRGAS